MQPNQNSFENSIITLMKEKPEEKPTLLGVKVREDGQIHIEKTPQIPDTIFMYKGVSFTIRFEKEEQGWSIHLYGSLGKVPYTLESVPARMAYLVTLCASQLRKDTACQLKINTEKNIVIAGKITVHETLTSNNALTQVIRLLWEIEPYMDIIQQANPFVKKM